MVTGGSEKHFQYYGCESTYFGVTPLERKFAHTECNGKIRTMELP